MDTLIWLVMGGIIGWLASLLMRTSGRQGVVLNVVVGIVGAFIGGWLGPLLGLGGGINGSISVRSVIVSLVGAVLLLAVVNLFSRGRVR